MTVTTTIKCPQSQSLNDWLFYLESQHPAEIELGLSRVKQVAEMAQLTDLSGAKIVLVAGTNGKGTTIRFMERYLIALGHSVGVYSSPHMHIYNERVRINDKLLSDDAHIKAFETIEDARSDVPLTYFEYGTLAAFHLFKQAKLDYVLVEVGLGGRLDATNILPHDVSIVTSLGFDHVDWLGDTIEQIGFEKAGIFRSDKPAVVGLELPPVTVMQQAENIGVNKLIVAGQDYHTQIHDDGLHWDLLAPSWSLKGLPRPLIPIQNVATAINGLIQLDVEINSDVIVRLCHSISLYGRMQLVQSAPMAMVDVGHNSHAIQYLIDTIKTHPKFGHIKNIEVVIAMMADKDVSASLETLAPFVTSWHIAPLHGNLRALTVEHMAQALQNIGATAVHHYPSIESAWHSAITKIDPDTLLLGVGSFYTVAEVLSCAEVEN